MNELNSTLDLAGEDINELEEEEIFRMQHKVFENMKVSLCNM